MFWHLIEFRSGGVSRTALVDWEYAPNLSSWLHYGQVRALEVLSGMMGLSQRFPIFAGIIDKHESESRMCDVGSRSRISKSEITRLGVSSAVRLYASYSFRFFVCPVCALTLLYERRFFPAAGLQKLNFNFDCMCVWRPCSTRSPETWSVRALQRLCKRQRQQIRTQFCASNCELYCYCCRAIGIGKSEAYGLKSVRVSREQAPK